MLLCFITVAMAVFLLDITLKQSVEERFGSGEERKICKGRVVVRKVHNKGTAWNLFEKHSGMVRRVSALLTGFILCYDMVLLQKKGSRLKKVGMMFLTGGALSNVYERILKGYVTDYVGFQTKWPSLTKITFNLGDFAIFAGAVLTCLGRK